MLASSQSLAGVATATLIALAASTGLSFAKDGDIKFKCGAKAQKEMRLHARYEARIRSKGLRQKFQVEFEARSGAGQPVVILVDSVPVGTFAPSPAPSGEISGELRFDSKPGNGHTPFPADFPDIVAGSLVEAAVNGSTVIGCELQ